MKNEIREYIPAEILASSCQFKYFPLIRHRSSRNGVRLAYFDKIHEINNEIKLLFQRLYTTPECETEDRAITKTQINQLKAQLRKIVNKQERKYRENFLKHQQQKDAAAAAKREKRDNNRLPWDSYEVICKKTAEEIHLQWDRVIAGRAAYLKAHGELLDPEEV